MKKEIPMNEKKAESIDPDMFFHSRCCAAHWELAVMDGEWWLFCESCGLALGKFTELKSPEGEIIPIRADCKCSVCGKGNTVH